MKNPIDDIMPRDLDPTLKKVLNKFSDQIYELADFGANLISWDSERTAIKYEDLPAILFLRNFIEQIDAIGILLNQSAIEPCKNLLRTAIENLFYLEYLLKEDSYNRAMAFLTWNCITNNKNLERLDKNSEEYKKLEIIFSKDKLMRGQKPPTYAKAEEFLRIGNNILNSEKFRPFMVEHKRMKDMYRGKISWYTLFDGPRNIKDLADKLEHTVLYDGFFRSFSSSVHGTDIIQGKLISNQNDQSEILQLRSPVNAQLIVQSCFNCCLAVFPIFVKARIPERRIDYLNWHLKIRSFHLELMQTQFIKPTRPK